MGNNPSHPCPPPLIEVSGPRSKILIPANSSFAFYPPDYKTGAAQCGRGYGPFLTTFTAGDHRCRGAADEWRRRRQRVARELAEFGGGGDSEDEWEAESEFGVYDDLESEGTYGGRRRERGFGVGERARGRARAREFPRGKLRRGRFVRGGLGARNRGRSLDSEALREWKDEGDVDLRSEMGMMEDPRMARMMSARTPMMMGRGSGGGGMGMHMGMGYPPGYMDPRTAAMGGGMGAMERPWADPAGYPMGGMSMGAGPGDALGMGGVQAGGGYEDTPPPGYTPYPYAAQQAAATQAHPAHATTEPRDQNPRGTARVGYGPYTRTGSKGKQRASKSKPRPLQHDNSGIPELDSLDACLCTTQCTCKKGHRVVYFEDRHDGSPLRGEIRYVLRDDIGKDCGDHSQRYDERGQRKGKLSAEERAEEQVRGLRAEARERMEGLRQEVRGLEERLEKLNMRSDGGGSPASSSVHMQRQQQRQQQQQHEQQPLRPTPVTGPIREPAAGLDPRLLAMLDPSDPRVAALAAANPQLAAAIANDPAMQRQIAEQAALLREQGLMPQMAGAMPMAGPGHPALSGGLAPGMVPDPRFVPMAQVGRGINRFPASGGMDSNFEDEMDRMSQGVMRGGDPRGRMPPGMMMPPGPPRRPPAGYPGRHAPGMMGPPYRGHGPPPLMRMPPNGRGPPRQGERRKRPEFANERGREDFEDEDDDWEDLSHDVDVMSNDSHGRPGRRASPRDGGARKGSRDGRSRQSGGRSGRGRPAHVEDGDEE